MLSLSQKALRCFLDDEAGRLTMGARGLELARREYLTVAQGERFEALYLSLLSRSRNQ